MLFVRGWNFLMNAVNLEYRERVINFCSIIIKKEENYVLSRFNKHIQRILTGK